MNLGEMEEYEYDMSMKIYEILKELTKILFFKDSRTGAGSVALSACCTCRGPRLRVQHPEGES